MGGSDEKEHAGSFAEGGQTLPHTQADHDKGHFSEGQERDHTAVSAIVGSFSDEDLKAHADHERMGSFGDVDCPVCRANATSTNSAR